MHRSPHHAPLICHCEEAAGRRGNLGKAVTILPGLSCDPAGYCEIATAPSGPRNDTSGGCGGAPAPLRGLIALYRALTERRYRPRRDRFHFNDSLCVSTALRREGHAPPLQWRVRSTMVPGNLQLPMAVTTRKGHAASVRRQSRQRLRSDRRYRRNRFVRFIGSRYESAVPPPRLPRAQSALAMTIWGAFTILTIACTGGRCVAGRGMPRPYFFTHTGAADKCPSPRRKQADFRGKSFKKLLHSGYFSVIIRTIYSRLY